MTETIWPKNRRRVWCAYVGQVVTFERTVRVTKFVHIDRMCATIVRTQVEQRMNHLLLKFDCLHIVKHTHTLKLLETLFSRRRFA
jgi:hypothetical protein